MAAEAEAASLLEKYTDAGQYENNSAQVVQQHVLAMNPEWETYGMPQADVLSLRLLEAKAPALKNKTIMQGNVDILRACMDVLVLQDGMPAKWILTVLYNMLREDSSCYQIFEDALKAKVLVYKRLADQLEKRKGDTYICDKAFWILTSVMGHAPQFFKAGDVEHLVSTLCLGSENNIATERGAIEALANLLKCDQFRRLVWAQPGIPAKIFSVQAKEAQAPVLYKSIFAIWLLSGDQTLLEDLRTMCAVEKVRDTLTTTRVEKVVRMCLLVVRNLLTDKALCEEVAESSILQAVQALEYEKWRDAELYDDIREVAGLISNEVHEMSNFDRYEKELHSGKLTWTFVHTSKFWGENVMRFEQNDFLALKALAALVSGANTDATTLAVALHDIGEFVTRHPLGKNKVAELQIKERIMELMAFPGDGDEGREVRREALLCCQKLMLNRWQDVGQAK